LKFTYNQPADTGNLDAQRAWTDLSALRDDINADKMRIATAVERGEGLPDEATQAAVTAKEVRFNVALADFKKKYITLLGYNATRSAPKPVPIRRPDAEVESGVETSPLKKGLTRNAAPPATGEGGRVASTGNLFVNYATPDPPKPGTMARMGSAARTAASGVASAARTAADSVRSRLTRKAAPPSTTAVGPLGGSLWAEESPLVRDISPDVFKAVEDYDPAKREAAAKKKANEEMMASYEAFKKSLKGDKKKSLPRPFTNADGYLAVNYGPLSESYRRWSASQPKRGGRRLGRKTRRRN
jgi:hypothetical protein